MVMNLGVVYKNGKIINHRSLVKVIINPFLRLIGFNIETVFDPKNKKLYYPKIARTEKKKTLTFVYELEKDFEIKKKRRII